jgi:hypothetical protein
MDLRTIVNITPSPDKITYNKGTMFIGSCFASSIGQKMEYGRFPVIINPAGSVYNPVSVCNTLDSITSGKRFTENDLYNYKGTWLSFSHYTNFSSEDPAIVLEKINSMSEQALTFLKNCRLLFITFGTARVFRLKSTGKIVSNCHKLPADLFTRELLPADTIVNLWKEQIDKLKAFNPLLKIVFTVSPVRHWKDGAHGNQVSKSVLFLSIEDLLKYDPDIDYFPAYELLMDDLRDYRYYADDMLHPSDVAVNYIWKAFCESYFEKTVLDIYNDVSRINKACSHRLKTDSNERINDFAEKMLKQISDIEKSVPSINFSEERNYFKSLLK